MRGRRFVSVILEGGDYDGEMLDLDAGPDSVFGDVFVIRRNLDFYRSVGEIKNEREVMVYDG